MNARDLVALALALIAPLLVGLLTKSSTPSGLKAALLAGLSVAVGVGNGFVNTAPGQVWEWRAAVVTAVVAWVVAVATHFGLYKPAGVTARLQAVGPADPTG